MNLLQSKNCFGRSYGTSCAERQAYILFALVTKQFSTAYATLWGPRFAGGAEARPECLYK